MVLMEDQTYAKPNDLVINTDKLDADHICNLVNAYKDKEDAKEHLSEKIIKEEILSKSFFEIIVASALKLEAKIIRIEPEEKGLSINYNSDGVAQHTIKIENYTQKIDPDQLPEDTQAINRLSVKNAEINLSINYTNTPTTNGSSVVIFLNDLNDIYDLNRINPNQAVTNLIDSALNKDKGLVLVVGPAGNGKTTTINALLQKLQDKSITVFDPYREYHSNGNTVEVEAEDEGEIINELNSITEEIEVFAGVEIRSKEMAKTVLKKASNKHLSLSTMHTNTAAGTFLRLVDMEVEDNESFSAINLVIAQRLVRVLCPHCKKEKTPTAEETEVITQILKTHPYPPNFNANTKIYEPCGCSYCNHTGYKGRQAVFEAIVVDEKILESLKNNPTEESLLKASLEQKVPTFAENGIEKVVSGVTSLEELQRVVDID